MLILNVWIAVFVSIPVLTGDWDWMFEELCWYLMSVEQWLSPSQLWLVIKIDCLRNCVQVECWKNWVWEHQSCDWWLMLNVWGVVYSFNVWRVVYESIMVMTGDWHWMFKELCWVWMAEQLSCVLIFVSDVLGVSKKNSSHLRMMSVWSWY